MTPSRLTRLLLLTLGTVGLFCGYVEHYGPLACGVLAFILVGLRHLRGACSLWGPALVMAVTAAAHFSAVLVMGAALVWLAIREWREGNG